MNWSEIKYMKRHEWKQDPSRVHEDVVLTTEALRVFADCKIYIHEAWAKDGHAVGSDHYKGMAVDLHFEKGCYSFQEQFILISLFSEIKRVGYYPTWNNPGWHLGFLDRPDKDKFWVRKEDVYYFGAEALAKHLIYRKFWQV